MIKKLKYEKSGFALVEVIIVVLVIAILCALGYVVATRVKDKKNSSATTGTSASDNLTTANKNSSNVYPESTSLSKIGSLNNADTVPASYVPVTFSGQLFKVTMNFDPRSYAIETYTDANAVTQARDSLTITGLELNQQNQLTITITDYGIKTASESPEVHINPENTYNVSIMGLAVTVQNTSGFNGASNAYLDLKNDWFGISTYSKNVLGSVGTTTSASNEAGQAIFEPIIQSITIN